MMNSTPTNDVKITKFGDKMSGKNFVADEKLKKSVEGYGRIPLLLRTMV